MPHLALREGGGVWCTSQEQSRNKVLATSLGKDHSLSKGPLRVTASMPAPHSTRSSRAGLQRIPLRPQHLHLRGGSLDE